MKKLLLLYIFFQLFAFVGNAQIKLIGNITTNGVANYPTHIDSLGKGGYMVMPTLASRNGIPTLRRKFGMLVFVQEVDSLYKLGSANLDNSNWVALSLSSASDQGAIIGSKLNIADTSNMLRTYRESIAALIADTALVAGRLNNVNTSIGNLSQSISGNLDAKLNTSDTTSMLSNYRNSIKDHDAKIMSLIYDTTTLQSRFDAKVNIADTANMLSSYLQSIIALNADTLSLGQRIESLASSLGGSINQVLPIISTGLDAKLNWADTTSMLSNYKSGIINSVKYSDTSRMLNNYKTGIISAVKYTDTANMLSSYLTAVNDLKSTKLNASDTANLSISKLNIKDTSTMLRPYLDNLKSLNEDTVIIAGKLNTIFTALANAGASLSSTNTNIDSKLNISDTALMLSNRFLRDTSSLSKRIDLANGLINQKVNIADTALMLSRRFGRDTVSLSNRIDINKQAIIDSSSALNSRITQNNALATAKLSITDTAAMLSGYKQKLLEDSASLASLIADTVLLSNRISVNKQAIIDSAIALNNRKLNTADTASLSNRISINKQAIIDSAASLNSRMLSTSLSLSSDKVNYSDTSNMLSAYRTSIISLINDTITLANRFNLKLNSSDTSAMLNSRFARDTASISDRINVNSQSIASLNNLVNQNSASLTSATASNNANTLVLRDATGNFAAGTITASLAGNASTTTALTTGRTISTTGDISYTSESFDGTKDVTGVATLANTGVTSATYGTSTAIPNINVDSKGRITAASTVSIPTATNTITGLLSSADYVTFNSKQGTISLTTTGSGGPATFVSNVLNIPQYTASTLGAVTANPFITPGTGTKITFDEKGLVTSSSLATTQDINPAGDRNYLTAAQAGIISNTSGVNTGDQTIVLIGDVAGSGTGSFGATVNSVGGVSSSTIATLPTTVSSHTQSITTLFSNINTANASLSSATSSNTANTIVLRDQSGNFSAGTITANLDGNATSATTAGNITASTNTTLTSLQNLSVIGTITAGVWNATTIDVAHGGTGVNTSTGTGSVVLSISPEFTGTPKAPTALVNDNSTQIATTAFVQNSVSSLAGTISNTLSGGLSAKESISNKVTSIDASASANDATLYPSVQALKSYVISSVTAGTQSNTQTLSTLTDKVTSNTNSITALTTSVDANTLSLTNATSDNISNRLVLRDTSGNFAAGTITASLAGNSSTTTKLATSKSIYGNAFDGTTDLAQTIGSTYGGTGVNNGGKTITLGGNITTASDFTTSGNFNTTITSTGITNITLPTTGTIATLSGVETLVNKTLASPNLTGTPTAITAPAGTSTTQIATTEFVSTLVGGSATPDATAIIKGKIQLSGDLTGTASSPIVNSVGGSNSSTIHTAEVLANAATDLNTSSAIVKRDASGNFSTSGITATSIITGTVSATSINATNLKVTAGTPQANAVLTSDASGNASWSTNGLYTLNGISANGQTFANTTNNTSLLPAFVSTGSVHNLNIPMASVANTTAGLISNADYAVFNSKQASVQETSYEVTIGTTTSLVSGSVYAGQANGVATYTFTLPQAPSAKSYVKMYINGVRISNAAYNPKFGNVTITYTSANNGSYLITSGDRIQFDYFY